MALTDELRKIDGLDVDMGLMAVGKSEKLYARLLGKLVALIDENLPKTAAAADADDAKALAFESHALKGASYNLGFSAIGDMAKDLEECAKADNLDKCKRSMPDYCDKIRAYQTSLKDALASV